MPDSPRGPSETLQPGRKGRRGGGGFRFPGLMIGRTSPHEGSKPGHAHVTDVAQDEASAARRAQAWSQATGRPLPPWLRARQPLRPATRKSSSWREESYGSPLTPAQFGRLIRKAKMTPQQRAEVRPVPVPGPRAPRSPGQRARARKNAAQQARHQARLRARPKE